jgi:capsular exopolysaccharide synthesis family protein
MIAAKATSPRKKIIVGLAGAFGLMVGLGLVVGLYLLDRSLRTRKQIEQTLGLPVLAEICDSPEATEELRDSLVVFSEPHSLAAESFRSLRTSLSTLSPRSVLITSAMPGDGKSFCALNLALLQAQLGYRTLLVDADFRRPSLSGALMYRHEGGFDAAAGALEQKNVCERTPFPNLFLINCAQFAPQTGEMMNGEQFAAMLWEAYRSFDCVIIDTSPLCLVSDALHFARYADAVALVVRAGETQTSQAQHACRELRRLRVPLAGCILNGISNEGVQKAYFETYQPVAHHRPSLALPGDASQGGVPQNQHAQAHF